MFIRALTLEDAGLIKVIYKRAFAGFPWFEDLSDEEVESRWQTQINKPSFQGIVALEDDVISGAIWWDYPTLDTLRTERGNLLANLSLELCAGKGLIWEREVIVDPELHCLGIGSRLRSTFIENLKTRSENKLILTRMRDDNTGIIKIAERLGFKRSGIRLPCSIKPEVCHEYWYLSI